MKQIIEEFGIKIDDHRKRSQEQEEIMQKATEAAQKTKKSSKLEIDVLINLNRSLIDINFDLFIKVNRMNLPNRANQHQKSLLQRIPILQEHANPQHQQGHLYHLFLPQHLPILQEHENPQLQQEHLHRLTLREDDSILCRQGR